MKTPTNAIYTGDNLPVLAAMPDGCVDLIYLDPPFNTGVNWEKPLKINGRNETSTFKDRWTLQDINDDDMHVLRLQYPSVARIIAAYGAATNAPNESYLVYMALRLAQMRRILKPTGSIYLHCDKKMSHSLKCVMDAMFGVENFQSEVIWDYYHPPARDSKLGFKRRHDNILYYTKDYKHAKFNKLYDGKPTKRMLELYQRGYNTCNQHNGERWLYVYDKAKAVAKLGDLSKAGFDKIKYKDAHQGKVFDDVFNINSLAGTDAERVKYVTQKPLELLDRIILSSSDEGDVVLDPFCGCTTTCVSAELHGRKWIGIDLSPLAIELLVERMKQNGVNGYTLSEMRKRNTPPKLKPLSSLPDYNKKRSDLHKQQRGICPACDKRFDARQMEIDHIVSRARGGDNEDWNLQALCGPCNKRKSSHTAMKKVRRDVLIARADEEMRKSREKAEKRRERALARAAKK